MRESTTKLLIMRNKQQEMLTNGKTEARENHTGGPTRKSFLSSCLANASATSMVALKISQNSLTCTSPLSQLKWNSFSKPFSTLWCQHWWNYSTTSYKTYACVCENLIDAVLVPFADVPHMQDLALRGFWLQKWMSLERAKECRVMIDYLLGLVSDGKFKYEYVYPNIALFRKFVLWLWLPHLHKFLW